MYRSERNIKIKVHSRHFLVELSIDFQATFLLE